MLKCRYINRVLCFIRRIRRDYFIVWSNADIESGCILLKWKSIVNFMLNEAFSLFFSFPSINRRLSINEYWKPENVPLRIVFLSPSLARAETSLFFIFPFPLISLPHRDLRSCPLLNRYGFTRLNSVSPGLNASRYDVTREASLRNLIKNRRRDLFVLNNRVMCSRERKARIEFGDVENSAANYSCPSYSFAAITRVALNISNEYPVVAVHARLTLAELSRDKCARV